MKHATCRNHQNSILTLMKNSKLNSILTTLAGLTGLAATSAALAGPLGTAFTYQGKLNESGQPANGIYDFIFTIYNSPTNELPLWSGVLNDDVTVTNGVFTTEIDFGVDLFNGDERWLQVSVRPGAETGDVMALLPRHHLTATPYAHFARRAAVAEVANTASNINWTAVKNLPPSLADGVDNDTTYSAGSGLSLNGANQFSVSYGGSGNATTAARSDHGHFGHEWIGATNNAPGLRVQNTSNAGIGVWGKNDQYGSGFSPFFGAGIFGDSSTDPGVAGFSNTGPGVYGWTSALNATTDAVKGENPSATGRGVPGYATGTNGYNLGVLGQTASTAGGVGVRGYATATTGSSYGGRFSNRTPDGAAIHGFSELSTVAHFETTNPANSDPTVEVRNDGKGIGARFTVGNATNVNDAVVAKQLGQGNGVYASAFGQGNAGSFNLFAHHTNNSAVLANGFGAARGLKAVSASGEAIRAESSGTAIVAASDATALNIERGAIRVKGAGVNTGTAVFIHECTSANTPAFPNANNITYINHPMCNGRPDAILFVTPRAEISASWSTYDSLAIDYNSSEGKWSLINVSLDELGDFDVGDRFNVMVVLP